MSVEGGPGRTARLRVAVYVTRVAADGRELLVFDHVDFPEAGTQIPAGGVEPDERLSDAAVREVREEVGLSELKLDAALSVQRRAHPLTGEDRITVFFHAESTEVRDEWTHQVASGGSSEDNGLALRCFFVPLIPAPTWLADAQGDFTDLIPAPAG